MDVQMPELDGFAATAAIRAQERTSGAHIPIIAMTARAMHGDRERCLAAGMDSYISKPLEIETFAQVVATLAPSLVKEHESPADLPAHESDIGASSKPIFDHDRLRAQTLGKPDLLAKVIGLFLADYPQQLAEIRAAAAAGDARRAEAVIHSLRGTLRSLGADAAHATASTIESLARQGDLDAVMGMCAELERELERLCVAFEEAGLCAS
jgi:HPt (histidine-containing phosphotransfer) domain-containing protein